MRCIPINPVICSGTMAALGGMRLVADRQRVELALVATTEKPARQIDIVPSDIRMIGGSWPFCCSIKSPRSSSF